MNFSLEEFLNREFLENTYRDYALFIGIILLGLIFKLYISKLLSRALFYLIKRFSKHGHPADFVALLRKPFEVFFLFLIILIASNQLNYPSSWHLSDTSTFGLKNVVKKLEEVAFVLSITWICLRIIDYFAVVITQRRETEDRAEKQVITFIKELSKILLVILSFFFILGSIFAVNVASLIAGLGIGGLAIALAAQETLANLIGSFVIFLDKPFEVGDQVRTEKYVGIVEQIGFRSTKIRIADRSLLIVPNKAVASETLSNITKSTSRRVKILLGLVFDTKPEQIKQIIKDIEEAISQNPNTYEGFTVFFDGFGESSLNIEVSFFTMSNDGDLMQQTKQEINYRIMEIVQKNGSDFAFPTRTLFMREEKGSGKDK